MVAWSWFVRSSSSVVLRFWLFARGFLCEVVCLQLSISSAPSVRGRLFEFVCPWSYLLGHTYVIVRSYSFVCVGASVNINSCSLFDLCVRDRSFVRSFPFLPARV